MKAHTRDKQKYTNQWKWMNRGVLELYEKIHLYFKLAKEILKDYIRFLNL